jgi:hypothetical protein
MGQVIKMLNDKKLYKKVPHFVIMLNWLHETVLVIKFGEEKISMSQFSIHEIRAVKQINL